MDNWNWKKVYFLGFLFSCPAKAQGIGKQHNSNQSLHLLVRSDKAVRLTTACGDVRLRTEEQPTVHEKKKSYPCPQEIEGKNIFFSG
jgi:hypothetical protein